MTYQAKRNDPAADGTTTGPRSCGAHQEHVSAEVTLPQGEPNVNPQTAQNGHVASGSYNIDDPDRPRWSDQTEVTGSWDYCKANGVYCYTTEKGLDRGEKVFHVIRKAAGYTELGLGDENWLPYRLPELLAAPRDAPVLICEGEKDVETGRALGWVATCNPCGALKWRDEFSAHLTGRDVIVLPDNDERGRAHARKVFKSVSRVAKSVTVVELPSLPEKGDLTDWAESRREQGGSDDAISEALRRIIDDAEQPKWLWSDAVDPRDPMAVARQFLAAEFPVVEGVTTLRIWKTDWYRWTGPCWREISREEMTAQIYLWLEQQFQRTKDGGVTPVKPGKTLVGEVMEAAKAVILVPNDVEVPAWIETRDDDWTATEMVSVENGLLHLPTAKLRQHTPRLFALNSIQASWNADAWEKKTEPKEFLKFLGQVIKEDTGAQVKLLQEMFGYMLTPDTKYQTAFMLIGPRRSGKGTIGRILQKLHAKDYVSPSLNGLADKYGKQSLIGKTIAVVPDVRIGPKTDLGSVAETILSITGEDPQTVQRKWIGDWTGFIKTRFLLMANSVPRLHDHDTVLASRFFYLRTDQSYFGREDRDLGDRLMEEINLILLWAVRGWQQLNKAGRFTESDTHKSVLKGAETVMGPIRAFIDTCCNKEPELFEETFDLYTAFQSFAEENGVGHFEMATFAKKLHSEMPTLKTYQPRTGGNVRRNCKKGLELRDEWRGRGHEESARGRQGDHGGSERGQEPDNSGPVTDAM